MTKYLLILLSLNIGAISYTSSEVKNVNLESRYLHQPCSRSEFCSPWYYCHEGRCKLGELPPHDILKVDGKHISVLDNTCVTYNNDEHLMEAGYCIYNFIHVQSGEGVYYQLPKDISELNEDMCGAQFNRTGTLCGKCTDGTYPLVYSYEMTCVPCPNGKSNWWKFVLAAFLPLTFFYFIILFLKINITSSSLFGFVYTVQTLTHPEMMRLSFIIFQKKPEFLLGLRILAAFCSIWNLDFLRSYSYEICLGTNTLQTMALDLAIGVYPLLLMMLSYLFIVLYDRSFRPLVFLLKPFRIIFNCFRTNWDIRTSTIDVFATFILLSNVKFLSISFDLLAPVKVYQLNSTGNLTHNWRVFYHANLIYFGEKHLPYAILAIVTLISFVLIPVLLLVVYPFRWFQKLLNLFPFRWYILNTFVDSFQGCYKDGTVEGTRDYRWFASLFFILRLLFFLIASWNYTLMFFVIASILVIIVLILLIIAQPFKENVKHYSTINAGYLLLMTMFLVGLVAIQMSKIRSPQLMSIILISLIVTAVISLLYLPAHYISMRKCWNHIHVPIRRLQARMNGYSLL